MGFRQSRRDDLIALGYTIIYFIRGSLPWQGLEKVDAGSSNFEKVAAKKQ